MNAALGHLPTRSCPHRQCALLHRLILVMLLPGLLTAVVYGGAATAVLLVLLGSVQLGVVLLTHALIPEGAHRSRDRRRLTVRSAWAALAIAADLAAFLAALAFMTALAVDHSHAAAPAPTAGTFALLGAVSVLLALHYVAHRRATTPAVQPAADDLERHRPGEMESSVWECGDMAGPCK
ncbi:hypothetical protein ABZ023_34665 [Streptomyces sp. NPDC006367]|uniref:hypothetical protein n=1 Tax=unclassified Streptomyces TaxID=2593676 RepID=UPI00339FED12